jgi:hypothetical protein
VKKHIALATLFFCSTFTATVSAQGHLSEWDRDSALAAIHAVDIDTEVYALTDIAALADARFTLEQLNRVENRADWPLPAREAVIYRFARSLARLPGDAVAPEVMQHLKDYEARTLVPHEDHPNAFMPLFNIRAAAAGVENGWARQEFAFRAQTLLASNPGGLVEDYQNANDPNQRRAVIDVLGTAGLDDLRAVQQVALERLAGSAELSPLVAAAAAGTLDVTAIEQLLIEGGSAGLSVALTDIGNRLPPSEINELLAFAIDRAPPGNAGLAIAAWAPRAQHDAGTRELLLETLAHPALGASAALALAQQPDIHTIRMLQAVAAGDSSAAKRAQMALDLHRDKLLGEPRQ